MILVFVHGISNDRPRNWSDTWATLLRPLLPERPSALVDISWESVHEAAYEPSPSARTNFLQDLGALNNPAVKRYTDDIMRSLVGAKEPIWIIAHSLGTAVIWQSLAYLQAGPSAGLKVERLVTVGSPLWLPYGRIVRHVVSLNAAMPRAHQPINVGRWINIAGRFDPVAGFGIHRLPKPIEHRIAWPRQPQWQSWGRGWDLNDWRHPHSFASYARSRAFSRALSSSGR